MIAKLGQHRGGHRREYFRRFRSAYGVLRRLGAEPLTCRTAAFDPTRTWPANFAVLHNGPHDVLGYLLQPTSG